jgi:hypothetical protein
MVNEGLNAFAQVSWAEVGIFWTSIVLALITVTATVLNYLLLRTQKDPEVIVYATPDDKRPSIINLVIENIGPGMAKSVTFKMPDYFPANAFGFESAKKPENMITGPLIFGIPSLGPGAKRVITWGQFGGLKKGLGDEVSSVVCHYTRDRIGLPGQKSLQTECLLDIKSFEATDASDNNWDKKTAKELEKIAKVLTQSATGFKSIKIDCSISRGHAGNNLACFRHVALNQIRRENTVIASVNRKQKMATMSEEVLDLIVNA